MQGRRTAAFGRTVRFLVHSGTAIWRYSTRPRRCPRETRAQALPEWKQADGGSRRFAPVSHYIGLGDYLRNAWGCPPIGARGVRSKDAVILRVPSQIAAVMMPLLSAAPSFRVEVVSDPQDAFSPGAIRHPLRPVFRRLLAVASSRMPKRIRRRLRDCRVAPMPLPAGAATEKFWYSDVESMKTLSRGRERE